MAAFQYWSREVSFWIVLVLVGLAVVAFVMDAVDNARSRRWGRYRDQIVTDTMREIGDRIERLGHRFSDDEVVLAVRLVGDEVRLSRKPADLNEDRALRRWKVGSGNSNKKGAGA